MPELPEVESQLNYLRGIALGRTIGKVSVFEPRIIKSSSAASFRRGADRTAAYHPFPAASIPSSGCAAAQSWSFISGGCDLWYDR